MSVLEGLSQHKTWKNPQNSNFPGGNRGRLFQLVFKRRRRVFCSVVLTIWQWQTCKNNKKTRKKATNNFKQHFTSESLEIRTNNKVKIWRLLQSHVGHVQYFAGLPNHVIMCLGENFTGISTYPDFFENFVGKIVKLKRARHLHSFATM